MQISDLASVVSNFLYGDGHSCEAALRAYVELCKRLGEDTEATWALKEINGYSLNDSLPAYRKTHCFKVVSQEENYCEFDAREMGYIDSLPVTVRRGEWEQFAVQKYLPKIQGLTCSEDKLYVCLRDGIAHYENQVQSQSVVVFGDPTIRVAGDNVYSIKTFFTGIKVTCDGSVLVRMLSGIRERLRLDFEAMQKRHSGLNEEGTFMGKHNISINNCNNVQVAATTGVSCQHMTGAATNADKPIKRKAAKTILKIVAALGLTAAVAWWIYVKVSVSVTSEDDKKKSSMTIEGMLEAVRK